MFLNYVDVWRIPDNAKTASARASPVRRWGRFVSARKKVTPLLIEAALSALQCFLDGDFGTNTASARVSAIPVRVLVASRKTTYFQQHGFVV